MNLKQLQFLPKSRVKALFGLQPPVLAELLFQVLPELERRRTQRLQARDDRKRAFVPQDGTPRSITPAEKVLMTLVYLRHNVQHEVVGALFGCSADSSENAFHEVVPVLRDLFPAQAWDAAKQWQSTEPTWTPATADFVLIDSFETPVRRPSVQARQKRLYSGKKKQHTLKTQIATDPQGNILTLSAGHRGPQADLKIYEANPLPEPLADKPRRGDKAYVSSTHPEMTAPHKKPKAGELSEAQRAENRQLAAERVYVEHGIRRVKAWRILRDQYRLAVGLFALVAHAVVGLLQFSRFIT